MAVSPLGRDASGNFVCLVSGIFCCIKNEEEDDRMAHFTVAWMMRTMDDAYYREGS